MAESTLSPQSHFALRDLLLPTNPRQFGPITERLLLRSAAMLLAIFAVGAVLSLTTDSTALRAAGLSLVFPGGGFLYVAWPSLFFLSLVAMAFAVLLWWGLSAFFMVPLVWVASAVGSALLADGPRLWSAPDTIWHWAIPVIFATTVVTVIAAMWRSWHQHRHKVASVAELNEYLSTAEPPQALLEPFEPNDVDREVLGWMYELALQPPDQFEGFDWGEQYHGGTCLRYQLAFLGESLAVYAANALAQLPADRGTRPSSVY